MMKRFVAGVLVLGLLALAGCGGSKSDSLTKGPVKIGAIWPLSGPLALLGEESWRGAEVARLVRNKKGGIKGQQIEYLKADAPDASAAKSEAERLINKEGLKVLIGTYSSSLSLTASEVAERAGVPFFEMGAVNEQITGRPGFTHVYRTNPNSAFYGAMQIGFIKDYLSGALKIPINQLKLGIVHEDSAYGTSVAASVKSEAEKAGIKVVDVEPYNQKANDLTPVVLKLKQAQPDILIGVSYVNDAILLLNQMKEADFNVKAFIGSGGGHTLPDFAKGVGGSTIEGFYDVDTTQFAVNPKFTPGLDEFVQMYKETFKEEPRSGFSLINFAGALILFDSLEKAGSLDPDAIRKAALAMDVPMAQTAAGWGVKFDEKGQNTRSFVAVHQWTKEMKLVTVWPKEAAVAEPMPWKTWAERK